MSQELSYLLVVVGLFIVPRVLQRFRVPAAITSVALGAALGLGLGLFHDDPAVPLLSTLGIVALFLFAGMEVDASELKKGLGVTLGHLGLQLVLLALGTWGAALAFELEWRPALLVSLALFTPSTGFILDSLPGFGLTPQQRFWVKTKAVATELVALAALFVVVQSQSALAFGGATLVLVALVAVLPWVFLLFAQRVLPFAPKSEFAFLVILALVCAFVTRRLGVYYLVGAFVVGATAIRLRQRLPALASERLLVGIELFASFFIPFYFFKAGLHLEAGSFAPKALGLGLVLVAISVPVRAAVVVGYRRLALKEAWRDGFKVAVSLSPTLVFGLVLAEILKDEFAAPEWLHGALVVTALVTTLLPSVLLRASPPEFEAPEAPRAGETPPASSPATPGRGP